MIGVNWRRPARIDVEWTREQRDTVEALSLEHGNVVGFLYRQQGIAGTILNAVFDDGFHTNINENGEYRGP